MSTSALDDLQHDLSEILNSALAHNSLRPNNLSIIPHKKSWLLNLDCIVLADAGNIHDVLFIAARAALWDTRVPLTRPIEYKATARETGDIGDESGLDTRQSKQVAADFELKDYWNEGEILDGRDHWPLCITLYLVGLTSIIKIHLLTGLLDWNAAFLGRYTARRFGCSLTPSPDFFVSSFKISYTPRYEVTWFG